MSSVPPCGDDVAGNYAAGRGAHSQIPGDQRRHRRSRLRAQSSHRHLVERSPDEGGGLDLAVEAFTPRAAAVIGCSDEQCLPDELDRCAARSVGGSDDVTGSGGPPRGALSERHRGHGDLRRTARSGR